jgi:hypothetical protein
MTTADEVPPTIAPNINARSRDIRVIKKIIMALTNIVTRKLMMVSATPLDEAFFRVSKLIPRPPWKSITIRVMVMKTDPT